MAVAPEPGAKKFAFRPLEKIRIGNFHHIGEAPGKVFRFNDEKGVERSQVVDGCHRLCITPAIVCSGWSIHHVKIMGTPKAWLLKRRRQFDERLPMNGFVSCVNRISWGIGQKSPFLRVCVEFIGIMPLRRGVSILLTSSPTIKKPGGISSARLEGGG